MVEENTPEPIMDRLAPIRKDCPGCLYIHTQPTSECEQCGLIFSRWQDPQKRIAEQHLERIASKNKRWHPLLVTLVICFIVYIPISFFTIPDLEARVFGKKMQYTPEVNTLFVNQGQLKIVQIAKDSVTGREYLLDKIQLSCQTRIRILKADSGGNTTYQKGFEDIRMESGPQLEKTSKMPINTMAKWNDTWIMNPNGTRISSILDQFKHTAKQYQLSMNSLYPYPPEEEEKETHPQLLKKFSKLDTNILDFLTSLYYPNEKLRPSEEWKSPILWNFFTPHLILTIRQKALFRFSHYERNDEGFFFVVDWDWDITPQILAHAKEYRDMDLRSAKAGKVQGKAWIDYETGIVKKCEGEFEFILQPKSQEDNFLSSTIPKENLTIIFKGSHAFSSL